MTNAEIIKDQILIEDVLSMYGYPTNKYGRIPCPIHHGKNKTSFSYTDTGYNCFSCGRSGDVISLVMDLFNLSFVDAIKKLNNDFNLGLAFKRPTLHELGWYSRHDAERIAKQTEKEISRKAYLTIAGAHAFLMRNGCGPEDLDLLDRWLDEYMGYY